MNLKTRDKKMKSLIRILIVYFMAGIIYSQTHIMTLALVGRNLTLTDQLFALVSPLLVILMLGFWVKYYNVFTLFEIAGKYTVIFNVFILAAFQFGFRELLITSFAYALMMSCVPIVFTLIFYLYRSVVHAKRI